MARKRFSCDFETTTKLNDCRVWAYGYMEIGNNANYKIGNSLDEFMRWVEKEQADLYFHNLKFDGEFIVNWLLKRGFKHDKTGKKGTFSSVISSMGQWYIIDICYGYKGKHKQHAVIYDSLKKLPFPVKQIAKDFGLKTLKGDIDYHLERPEGWIITKEEEEYIYNDIAIIAQALHIQFKQGLDRITNGSDSLKGFKNTISSKLFDKHFPVLSLEMDANIRLCYRGGFTWLNEKYSGLELGDGEVFDVNSLYPSVMYTKALPYGMPIYYDGEYEKDDEYPLYIQHVRCEFQLKKGAIPTIQIKKNLRFKQNEYLKHSGGEVTDLYVTNVDWELINEHYEVYEPEYVSGWKFKSKVGLFNNFIDKWTLIKTTSEGAIKLLAKLMLNSLYGKFASNPDVTGKIPYLKEDGSCGYRVGESEYKDPVYTPMGVFITSYARELTIRTAQKCYDRIIYCDTDSIHLLGRGVPDEIAELVDPKRLGYWAHESTFKRGKYIRQKTYAHDEYAKEIEKDGVKKMVECPPEEATGVKFVVKCAGMPDKVKEKVTFENFEVGFTSGGKLVPKHVNGGVVLVDTDFTIK